MTVSEEHKNDGHAEYSDDSGHDDHWNGHELECRDLSLFVDKQTKRKKY